MERTLKRTPKGITRKGSPLFSFFGTLWRSDTATTLINLAYYGIFGAMAMMVMLF